jgi:RNA polymerase sigma-54 factor
MKQGLSLRVSQHLALTPQLQQSIRLLQLSTLELGQEIQQMLDDNPFLEVQAEDTGEESAAAAADAPRGADEPEAEGGFEPAAASGEVPVSAAAADAEPAEIGEDSGPSWDGDGSTETVPDDGEWGGEAPAARRNNTGDEDEIDATELARGSESLQSWLHRQALVLRLSEEDRGALRYLIESLNDDGYLEEPLEELARGLAPDDLEQQEELVHRFTVALGLLQSLDPSGVGARSLAECLLLQLKSLQQDAPGDEAIAAAQKICRQPIDLLAKRDIKRLVQSCGSEAQVKAGIVLITRLEPKPGRRFVDVERNIIVPDVLVTQVGRGIRANFRVQLNPDVVPRLRVHDVYAGALKAHRGEGHQALQQRLQEARWFIKNIQQRFDTILRVSTAIVERQRNFFIHGELAMRPLVLREIADELGLHESTISRVTTAKYMSTPFGTFELKYFFGSALGTETGGNASSTAVRALIKQFVAAENAKKPLSDSQISDMLKEQGIECARRTVAKYREALRIAPANLRKEL